MHDVAHESAELLLGPMLRHVGDGRATIWVEVDRACEVTVTAADHVASAPTWSVHGHHYCLVIVGGLPDGQAIPYEVALDGRRVWPLEGSSYPPSLIRTSDGDGTYRISFGSCRRSAPFDDEHLDALGADALVALADRMVGEGPAGWPDVLLLLGDQIYADEPSEAIVERLHAAG